MSIFPKRTIAGSTVTIHWNLALPAGKNNVICPYVRIGIIDPGGETHMLLDDHLLLLPSTAAPAPELQQNNQPHQYLNKHTPLLMLASCLAGKQSREKLIEILTNLQNGRHYYFTWPVPPDALPGKYTLLSEIWLNGSVTYSATAAEDFFYVEQLDVLAGKNGQVTIHNPGPEAVPVKIITYDINDHHLPESIDVFYLQAAGNHTVPVNDKSAFLVYNEERITVPLHTLQQHRPLRNQQYLFISKQEAGEAVSYVLPREGNEAYRLTGMQRDIWEAANGMSPAGLIRQKDSAGYDEMIAHGLINEIR